MILKIIDLRSQPHLQGASEFMFAAGRVLAKLWDVLRRSCAGHPWLGIKFRI